MNAGIVEKGLGIPNIGNIKLINNPKAIITKRLIPITSSIFVDLGNPCIFNNRKILNPGINVKTKNPNKPVGKLQKPDA